jgi:hypothetical protein
MVMGGTVALVALLSMATALLLVALAVMVELLSVRVMAATVAAVAPQQFLEHIIIRQHRYLRGLQLAGLVEPAGRPWGQVMAVTGAAVARQRAPAKKSLPMVEPAELEGTQQALVMPATVALVATDQRLATFHTLLAVPAALVAMLVVLGMQAMAAQAAQH